MIYMDNAASAPIHKDVVAAMLSCINKTYGNPSSIHRAGRMAKRSIEAARSSVAELINADPSEIFFTSGGTESNNTILRNPSYRNIITTQIEHDSILEPCRSCRGEKSITYLPPDEFGMISPESLESTITKQTDLVSIMTANNEVGTIQPIEKLSNICKGYGVPFHTDMVQAVGKMPIDVGRMGVDAASISSHKIRGPKGVGALYIRGGIKTSPLIYGGGQEGGLRSGTENVPAIVGFGEAARIARQQLHDDMQHVTSLRDTMTYRIMSEVSHVTYNGHPLHRLPGNAHLSFLGINGEDIIIKLDEYGMAASTGSACSVHTQKESHVLRAMKLDGDVISGSLRLTLGPDNTMADVDTAIHTIKRVVAELRRVSPLKEKYAF
ncbi:MAG: cysteine desulfurase [Cenarchaeum sp. SB0665_bin_23]|nr:cysteine desulfurase [Cenarchaeum sp. SB0667_bin_13]MXY37771.1 cysteine desulfurase [Cenarchaeum sp. SB0664_bin_35]MXY61781.1 cysteine desulfurase [Cenarchaeum sp. SB0665_bin_23]MXZ93583.1 cysteine desulfurase [Cenarchaeum sp. SB0666_bin_15]MYB46259.1 cysteine desulfurase [Cenarchaeum sp. SB0662_bin_33]MYC79346.1 cysteine desulfurase [Cenarchaeum sp. SB0661_bin_35]MYD58473.1 cysteine desulfurase [Cenarchaeum sp. SB0678_bin_8]MYG33418.1 cysteine desulfurase [Cenarchaeum sp. SB0677_bin_16]